MDTKANQTLCKRLALIKKKIHLHSFKILFLNNDNRAKLEES